MDESIKLPGSSFDEVSKVIQGYAHANKPCSLDDISKRTGMHNTVISRNNGFLVSIGVLGGGKNKAITPLGKKIGDALSHNLEGEIKNLLREIVDSNEFLKNLVGAIRIRKGMDEGALKAHVAYSAGVPKSAAVMTGTGTIVEILKRAGVVEERDGKLAASSVSSGPSLDPEGQVNTPRDAVPPNAIFKVERREGSVNLNIEVRVNCTPDELSGLGKKLREVIEDFERVSQSISNDIAE